MAETVKELEDKLMRIRTEMNLARFHSDRFHKRERELYADFCVALARVLDARKDASPEPPPTGEKNGL